MSDFTSTSLRTQGTVTGAFPVASVAPQGSTAAQQRDAGAEQVPAPVQRARLPGMAEPAPLNTRDLFDLIKYASDEELKFMTLEASDGAMRITGRLAEMYSILKASGNALAAALKRKAAEELKERAELQLFSGVMQGSVDLAGSAAGLVTAFNGGRKGVQQALEDGKAATLRQKGNEWLEAEYIRNMKSPTQTAKQNVLPETSAQKNATAMAETTGELSSVEHARQIAKEPSASFAEHPDSDAPSAATSSRRAKEEQVSDSDDADLSGLEHNWEIEGVFILRETPTMPRATGVRGDAVHVAQESSVSSKRSYADLADVSEETRLLTTSGRNMKTRSPSTAEESDTQSRRVNLEVSKSDDADLSGLEHGWEVEYTHLQSAATTSSAANVHGDAARSIREKHSAASAISPAEAGGDTGFLTSVDARSSSTRSSSMTSTESFEESISSQRKIAKDKSASESDDSDKHGQRDPASALNKPKPRIDTHGYDENGLTPEQLRKIDTHQQAAAKLHAEANKYSSYSMAFSAASNSAGGIVAAPFNFAAENKQVASDELQAAAQQTEAVVEVLSGSKEAQVQVFQNVLEMRRTTQQNSADSMRMSA